MKILKRVTYPTLSIVALAVAVSGASNMALAGPNPLIGDIMAVGENFCPRGWASAEGQLISIANNTALFSLIGTTFGGDGRSTMGLPDLRGRVAMGQGRGPGLTTRNMGQQFGAEARVLSVAQLPSHSHDVYANNLDGDKPGPGGKLLAAAPPSGTGSETIYSDQPPTVQMSAQMIANAGSSQPFNIQDPYLVMRYCIATQGTYPSRP